MVFSLIFALLFTHPLEKGLYSKIDISDFNETVCEDNYYLSPIAGSVIFIVLENNKYTIKISNDEYEMVFAGLDEVYKEANDYVFVGDKIGKDSDMSFYTRHVIVQYDKADIFPQFYNNRLYFTDKTGASIYSMGEGIVTKLDYDRKNGKGNYINIEDYEREINIEYWHLLSIRTTKNKEVWENEAIGNIGNTGFSIEPHLTVSLNDFDNFYDYKAIYIKALR
jgi:hypothetical protein